MSRSHDFHQIHQEYRSIVPPGNRDVTYGPVVSTITESRNWQIKTESAF